MLYATEIVRPHPHTPTGTDRNNPEVFEQVEGSSVCRASSGPGGQRPHIPSPAPLGVSVVKMDFLGPINRSAPDLSGADLVLFLQDLLCLEFCAWLNLA